jgi:hypothetical protein
MVDFEDSTGKAVAMAILGKSGAEGLQLLKDLAEQDGWKGASVHSSVTLPRFRPGF